MWVKVCGCVDPDNAAAVSQCGVDAIGINFYPRSKRFVGDRAQAVRDAIGNDVAAIGLFVDESAQAIIEAYDRLNLDAIQLHGNESIELIQQLAPRPVYRAIRVANGQIGATIDAVVAEVVAFPNLAGILIDAVSSKGLGGTGESIDWTELSSAMSPAWPRLVLAGGLTPENVATASNIVRPFGVDVASGVEISPGLKDIASVRSFHENACSCE